MYCANRTDAIVLLIWWWRQVTCHSKKYSTVFLVLNVRCMIWRWVGNIEYDTWWCVMHRCVPQWVTLLVEFYFCVWDRLSRHTVLSDSWSLAGTFVPFFWLRGSHGANVSETVKAFIWPTGSSKHYESSDYPVPTRAEFGPGSQSEYDEYVALMTSLFFFFPVPLSVIQRKKGLYLIFICKNVQYSP